MCVWIFGIFDVELSVLVVMFWFVVVFDFDGMVFLLVVDLMVVCVFLEVVVQVVCFVVLLDMVVVYVFGCSMYDFCVIIEYDDDFVIVLVGFYGVQYWFFGVGVVDVLGEVIEDGVCEELWVVVQFIIVCYEGVEFEFKIFGMGVYMCCVDCEIEQQVFVEIDVFVVECFLYWCW